MDKFEKQRFLLNKVLFIGGNPYLASTRIRTNQIARYLGCDYTLNSYLDENILKGKEIFILNKAFAVDRNELRKRGKIILDIIDPVGIPNDVDGYIFSSKFAQRNVQIDKPSFVIYQHHINFSNEPNIEFKEPKRVSYIGEKHWYPNGLLPEHKKYLEMNGDEKKIENQIIDAYRNTDILLNFRNPRMDPEHTRKHLILNGGIKVINAMAFGIPSISADEPVLREVGEGCTIFSSFEHCKNDLDQLLSDDILYKKIKDNCIKRSREFSIENISYKFIELFEFFNNEK